MSKTGNKLVERLSGEVTNPREYRSDYGPREDPWQALVVPVLRMVGAASAATAAGCSRRAVERAIRERGASLPRPATQARLMQAAADWTRAVVGGGMPKASRSQPFGRGDHADPVGATFIPSG